MSTSSKQVEPFSPPRRASREWDGTASLDKFRVAFSDAAAEEFRSFVRMVPPQATLEDIQPDVSHLEEFANDIERFRREVDLGNGMIIIGAIPELTAKERQVENWVVSQLLGSPLVQSSEGNRLVHVYDRDRTKRMEDGARYHQTRQGGSVHTDNVNAPEPWEYLVFGCIEPAQHGGESIVVNGYSVHSYLKQNAPDALRILEQDFFWEYRGIADDVYRAPIVTYGAEGDPYFRYLRTYLESAHRKVQEPLTAEQLWAMDVLDAALELSDLQLRIALCAGEILVTFDSQMFHGRTSFADHPEARSIVDLDQSGTLLRRTFERTWVRSPQLTSQLAGETE